jgi:hypothetical protein
MHHLGEVTSETRLSAYGKRRRRRLLLLHGG